MSSVIDELDVLIRAGASGALKAEGRRRGTVYLDEGRFVFAEAAGVPDLASRLIGARRLTSRQWNVLRTEGRPGEFGALLVERGILDETELTAVLRSAFLDAVTALTSDAERADLRFAPMERPWIGSVLDLETDFLREEVARRSAHGLPLQARPRLIDLTGGWRVVERHQWEVACRVDGVTTLHNLTWHNGLSLYETMESLDGLVQAGLCALPAPDPGVPSLPRREPGSTLWDRSPVEAGPTRAPDGGTMFTVPGSDLLKQIVQALREMD